MFDFVRDDGPALSMRCSHNICVDKSKTLNVRNVAAVAAKPIDASLVAELAAGVGLVTPGSAGNGPGNVSLIVVVIDGASTFSIISDAQALVKGSECE